MSVQGTATAFVKSAFYKTCFCIGLGTASYYSYAQVQTWVSDKPAAQAQDSSIQDKVNSLVSFGANGTTTTAMAVQQNPTALNQAMVRANPKSYLTLGEAKKEEAPVAVAAADASPSPSVSPSPGEATAERKDGDAKEGEKKEGEEQKPEGELAQQVPTGPVNEIGMPYAPYALQQNKAPEAQNTVAPDAQAQNAAAGYGGGIPTPGSSPYGASSGSGNTSYSGGGGIYVTPNTSGGQSGSGTTTFLSASDLSLLTSPIKASFADQTVNVSGTVCSIANPENNTVTNCVHNNHFAVHTNRWSTILGLSNDATFTVRSTSGSSQIKITVNLKIQNTSQTFTDISVDAYPSEVLVHSESRNGSLYKVYDLKLPDLTVEGGKKLSGVQATLVYQESSTAGAAAVMTSESALTFTRSQVETTGAIWDVSGPNREPAANEQVITADSISYSMSLEKSP